MFECLLNTVLFRPEFWNKLFWREIFQLNCWFNVSKIKYYFKNASKWCFHIIYNFFLKLEVISIFQLCQKIINILVNVNLWTDRYCSRFSQDNHSNINKYFCCAEIKDNFCVEKENIWTTLTLVWGCWDLSSLLYFNLFNHFSALIKVSNFVN